MAQALPASTRRMITHVPVRMIALAALIALPTAIASAYEIGSTQATFIDPERNNRSVESAVFYPAETGGANVPVAEGVFPVVVFGHGYLIPPADYQYLWTGLVPEGHIVVLPLTEGNLFPDHEQFGRDLAFLVTAISEDGSDPGSLLFGHVSESSAVMGHSMGGGASFLAASFSTEITALANLAAAETNPSAIDAATGIEIPSLVIAGSFDCVTPPEQHQIPMYESLASSCKAYVSLIGASHCQFAEENFLCSLGEGGCQNPSLSREVQQAITLAALLPWLRFVLEGDPLGWSEFQGFLESEERVTWQQDCDVLSAIVASAPAIADSPRLSAHPNPFRAETALRIEIAEATRVTLTVHDLAGRRVRTLRSGPLDRGTTEIPWEGRDESGRLLPHGLYWARIRAGEQIAALRLILLP